MHGVMRSLSTCRIDSHFLSFLFIYVNQCKNCNSKEKNEDHLRTYTSMVSYRNPAVS